MICLKHLNQTEKGLQMLRQALQIAPNHKQAPMVRQTLDRFQSGSGSPPASHKPRTP